MRKLIAYLMILCIFALMPSALAAPGDAFLFTNAQKEELGINSYNTPAMAAIGDSVYTLWGSDIYVWQTGSEAPEKIASDLPMGYYTSWEDAQNEMGDEAGKLLNKLLSDNDILYGLNSLNGMLYPLTFADGQAVFGTPIVLDWSEIAENQNNDEYVDIINAKIIDGTLYILTRTYENYDKSVLMSFDLATGAQKTWDVSFVRDITPYRDGKILLNLYDYETAYNYDTGEQENPTLAVFDPADGSVTQVGFFGNPNVYGIVYDAQSDTLYYTTNSKLMAMKALGEAVQVAYMPMDYMSDAVACLLPGGLYAINSWEGLIVRNTDPQYMPSSSLSIYGGYVDDAAIAFMTQYPDIPVTFSDNVYYSTSSAMAQAMASGDSAFDIYSISLNYQDFAGLMEKGYSMDLSPYTALTDKLSELYPFIQAGISQNGTFYAAPIYFYAYGLSTIPTVWEEAGIEDRIPTSFMGLIDFFQWWLDEGMDENPDLLLFQDAYDYGNLLFNMALNLYITQYQAEDKALTLDTPVFREMLEAIEALDIDTLNDTVPEMDENGGIMYTTYAKSSGDTMDNYLFSQYGEWISVYANNNYSTPLILPIEDGGTKYIPVEVQCMFVNPNTKQPDMAAAYLLNAMENMEETEHIMMFPEDNEPVVYQYYAEMVTEYEKMLAAAQTQLETAAPEEVKDIQASIDAYEEFLANKDDYYWMASEESIAAYRALVPLCYTATPNILSYSSNEEGTSEINTLIDRYLQKQMTLDQFITQADQKIRMILLEMQ